MAPTTPQPKTVTVSIVSHAQQALIVPLVEQLQRHCADSIAQIIVIINVPEPELLTQTSWQLPLTCLRNEQARGFGANHNRAFIHCDTPWFLVLNPDMRLDCDFLTPLLNGAHARSGLLAPRVYEPHKDHPEPHRAMLTPWEILRRHASTYVPPRTPAWVPGMCMLFRADAYRAIGGFDARYFMYGEDFDICARLRLQGWELQIAEQVRIEHLAQRASRRNWQHMRWHCASLLRLWFSRAFWRYRSVQSRTQQSPR